MNHPRTWLVAVGAAVTLLIAVLVIRFAGRGYAERRAIFPDKTTPTRLAIREPLVRPELRVLATLFDDKKRGTAAWMTVDSGATGVTLPDATYYGLGLGPLPGVRVRTEDARGNVFFRDAGLVPTVTFGDLEVREVVSALGGEGAILGQSILAHATWEVDWDRGTLTLGATEWPAGSAAATLPLRKEADAEIVTMHVDGKPIEMVLDTGAFSSTIPDAAGAGLFARAVRPTTFRSTLGELVVRKVFAGSLRLGELDAGSVQLAALTMGGKRAAFGLLGLDVLSRYRVQVVPGKRLLLRPRGDLRETAAQRIARWGFVPATCAHVGCVQGELTPQGSDASLTLTLEADLGRSVDVLLGCAGAAESALPTETRFAFGIPPMTPRHVRLRLPRGESGTRIVTAHVASGAQLAEGCTHFEALDLAPASGEPRAADAVEAASSKDDLQATLWP